MTAVYESATTNVSVSATDSHETNLFQPSITIDKTGDTLSKVGGRVNYTITVTNTSSADSPNLVGAVVDTMLGINQAVDMAPGDVVVINDTYTVLVGDPDPLLNTATVTISPVGFPNVISDSDDHSVNLFQPSIDIEMTVDALSKVGDGITYSITVTNTSSADSPNLVGNVTFSLTGLASEPIDLAPGASHAFTRAYTVQAETPDPLLNTATVTTSPPVSERDHDQR